MDDPPDLVRGRNIDARLQPHLAALVRLDRYVERDVLSHIAATPRIAQQRLKAGQYLTRLRPG